MPKTPQWNRVGDNTTSKTSFMTPSELRAMLKAVATPLEDKREDFQLVNGTQIALHAATYHGSGRETVPPNIAEGGSILLNAFYVDVITHNRANIEMYFPVFKTLCCPSDGLWLGELEASDFAM